MKHTADQILTKVKCLVAKALNLRGRHIPSCNEIDELVQEAQYIDMELQELEREQHERVDP